VSTSPSFRTDEAISEGSASARLALGEELLQASEEESCAETTLAWLEAHCGIEVSICLLQEPQGGRFRAVAGRGIDPAELADFTLDPADRSLDLALKGGGPALYRSRSGGPSPPATPLGRRDFCAMPLSEKGRESSGLLLLESTDPESPHWSDTLWAASFLGVRLESLRYHRLRAEERRRRQELSWFSGIIEAVTDPILLTDAEGRTLIANRAAESLLIADESMSEGRRLAVALNNMLFSASLFTGTDEEDGRREILLVDPVDGRDLLFELFCRPLTSEARELGTVSVLRNVTDLHKAAQELEENYWRLRSAEATTRAERDRLDLILNAALDPILVTDPEGAIVLTNHPAEQLFTADSASSGKEAERRVRSNDAVFTSFVSKLYASQARQLRGELSLSDPRTGDTVPVEAISAKILSPHGEENAVVTILHDLTEAKEKAALYEQVKRHSEELEQRVREATAELAEQNELLRRQALELEQASAMKSLFLANVSHELRTPLNAIIGYTSLLLEGVCGPISETQREKLSRLDSNAHHLLEIINSLLDISRIEAGKMPVTLEPFPLPDLVDEVMSEVEPLIPSGRVEVLREIPEELPTLVSDRQKVKQILINLLSNAFKFTPSGTVLIRARHHEEPPRFQIAVADTGVGISEERQEGIFEAFGESAVSLHRRHRGTGLGLSICRRLADLLEGSISLSSQVGFGSTFTLELPGRAPGDA
jgi:PAS domain S-box-containing protein